MENTKTERSRLKGKTVVITGASSGVGLAALEAFAAEECSIVVIARGRKGIDDAVSYCRALNVQAVGVEADMSIPEDVEKAVSQALSINGQIDIWINNAGDLPVSPLPFSAEGTIPFSLLLF